MNFVDNHVKLGKSVMKFSIYLLIFTFFIFYQLYFSGNLVKGIAFAGTLHLMNVSERIGILFAATNIIFAATPPPPPPPLPFPEKEDIPKYFLGFGFDANNSWYLWEEEWRVDYSTNYVNITNVNNPEKNKTFLYEGDNFSLLGGPDLKEYYFKVREIWSPTRVDFQPLNKSFYIKDFSRDDPIKGNGTEGTVNIIVYEEDGHAAMTSNGSAIWISDFQWSDEYRTLVKAAIASSVDEWTAKRLFTTKETTTVSSFYSLCCDMPETAELELILRYIV